MIIKRQWNRKQIHHLQLQRQKRSIQPRMTLMMMRTRIPLVSFDLLLHRNDVSLRLNSCNSDDGTSFTGNSDLVIDWNLSKKIIDNGIACWIWYARNLQSLPVHIVLLTVTKTTTTTGCCFYLKLELSIIAIYDGTCRLVPKKEHNALLTARSPFPSNHENPNSDGNDRRQAFYMEQYQLDLICARQHSRITLKRDTVRC